MSNNKQIRYPKTFSRVLFETADRVITPEGDTYITLPGWFKIGPNPCVMQHFSNEDIPDSLKEILEVANYLQLRSGSDKIILLEAFALFLEKEGYMDTDWRCEKPFAIDEFLKE